MSNLFKRIGAAIGQKAAEDYCASDRFKRMVEDVTFEAVYVELRKKFANDPARLAIIEANYHARKHDRPNPRGSSARGCTSRPMSTGSARSKLRTVSWRSWRRW